MSREKSITIIVSEESLKKIKKMAIDNDISASKQASLLMERYLSGKKDKAIEIGE